MRDRQELQAGSPGRSPQCRSRRSRAVASRDVTRRCSDATSRQGQPARLWSLGNPFSPYYSLLYTPARLPPPPCHPYPTSYRSRTLYRVHVPLLNELSPRPPSLALSLSRALLFSPFLPLPLPCGAIVATLSFSVT